MPRKKKNLRSDRLTKQEAATEEKLAFDEFKENIAPQLRKMLAGGASSKDIMRAFENYAAARTVTIALTEEDTGKALAAIKDIMDRTQGKAVERKKLEHSMADLSEHELDALLLAEEDDLARLKGGADKGAEDGAETQGDSEREEDLH